MQQGAKKNETNLPKQRRKIVVTGITTEIKQKQINGRTLQRRQGKLQQLGSRIGGKRRSRSRAGAFASLTSKPMPGLWAAGG
jgi:hypothetical protein